VRVRVAGDLVDSSVRMLGIDAPEVSKPVECWGRKSSAKLKRLLPVGTRVSLVSDATQDSVDRYGRLLRYVVKGKQDTSLLQVAKGNARVYVYDRPFERLAKYRSAQTYAKRANVGMWSRHC
jgi:endonuclease YncB( thermonuclease family)